MSQLDQPYEGEHPLTRRYRLEKEAKQKEIETIRSRHPHLILIDAIFITYPGNKETQYELLCTVPIDEVQAYFRTHSTFFAYVFTNRCFDMIGFRSIDDLFARATFAEFARILVNTHRVNTKIRRISEEIYLPGSQPPSIWV
jgi:hypothetical protein